MTKSVWDVILAHIAQRIGKASGMDVASSEIVVPPKPDLGDVSYGCFKLAKDRKISPADAAIWLVEKLKETDVTIASVSAVGPYLNIWLKISTLVPRIIVDLKEHADAFGQSEAFISETILFEYANLNTHKEVHVGHLRNLILGASLVRILRRMGATVIPVSYINDIGTHVAKCLWYLVKNHGFNIQSFSTKDLNTLISSIPHEQHTAGYLGRVYIEATQALEKDPTLKESVSFVHHALETHEPVWEDLWRKTKRWSMEELTEIFGNFGVQIERQYFESECLDRAQEIVRDLEASGIAKISQDALVIDMEDVKLGVMLLRKSDGSLLYAAKDLALAELKAYEYPTYTQSVILVDERQSLNFRQLAEALRRMGYTRPFEYLGYEIVTLPEGVMSSRKGTIITFQSFRDTILHASRASTLERHEDWSEGKVAYTAWCIAIAGMKYATLKQDPGKAIVFDIKRSLAFDGDTGPYIQYAATRLASILKKAGWTVGFVNDTDFDTLTTQQERRLVLLAAQLVDAVRRAAEENKPSIVAQWCFCMAQDIHAFYRDVPVIDAEPETKKARLQLVLLARLALLHGLDLLGIPVPDEM